MTDYKTYAIVDGKPRWIIINENGDIVTIIQVVKN